MFSLNDTMRYYLCPGKTDMRKGIYALCGVVQNYMKQSLRSGDVFIFVSRNRKVIKLLHAEKDGLVMYAKYLGSGRFRLPQYDEQTHSYQIEWRDLIMLVESVMEDSSCRLKRLKALRMQEYLG